MTQINEQTTTTPTILVHTSPCYREARAKVPGYHFPDPWKVAGHLIGSRSLLELVSIRDSKAGTVGTRQVAHWDAETAHRKDPSKANAAHMVETRAKLAAAEAEHDAWGRAVYIARRRRVLAEQVAQG